MKSISGRFFISGVRYEKTLEDGSNAKTTEQYLVDALSWSECEGATIENMSTYVSGDMEIVTMKRANFSELFISDKEDENLYYDCVLNFITPDEKTGKEKKSKVRYLVQGKSLENARKNIDETMNETMVDYNIIGIKEANILDVFLHKNKD